MNEVIALNSLMLIDDSAFDQKICKRIVERSGFVRDLRQYTSAQDALKDLKDPQHCQPNLILLDIDIQGMSGFDFLEAYQTAFGRSTPSRIVMLTTSMNPADRTRADEFGFVEGFLNKPLSAAMLRELVEHHSA
ncbi:MAG: response regulator [Pseudomonadota bacterium]